MADSPRVIVFGGCGAVGRHVVAQLVSGDLASKVRVVDKALPSTSFLNAEHTEVFANAKVEYLQKNLSNAKSTASAFEDESPYDLVINCAGETRYGQPDSVYEDKIFNVAKNIATESVKNGVNRLVHMSTAQVYEPKKKSHDEKGNIKPWTSVAEAHAKVEEMLKSMEGLNWNVVRPATIYGPGDTYGLAPRIIVAAVYKQLAEKMELLWTGGLKINTVNVKDVAKALIHVGTKCDAGTTFNVADNSDSTQQSINVFLSAIFGIETGFVGSIKSNLAKLNLASIVEDINDKHMKPWSDMLRESGVSNSCMSPFLDQELLYNNPLSVNGKAIEATGFTYDFPEVTEEAIREGIEYFLEQGIFPASALG